MAQPKFEDRYDLYSTTWPRSQKTKSLLKIDFQDYNLDLSENFNARLGIGKTFFMNKLLTLDSRKTTTASYGCQWARSDSPEKDLTVDLRISLPSQPTEPTDFHLTGFHYDKNYNRWVKLYNNLIVARDTLQEVDGMIQKPGTGPFNAKDQFRASDFQAGTVYRGNDNIRITASPDLAQDLSRLFQVSAFVCRMSDKSKTVDAGEYLQCTVAYVVKNGIPKLYIDAIPVALPDDKTVSVSGNSLSAGLCRELERRFTVNSIPVIQREMKPGDHDVYWREPTDWMDYASLQQYGDLRDIYYAMYMWWGIKEDEKDPKNPKNIYLYVGIVGTREANQHSLWKRLDEENTDLDNGQAAKNGITIRQVRYCALDCNNCGKDVYWPEVMQTTEMQCINAISSLFPYLKDPDPVIHPLFDSVRSEKFSGAKIHLVNSDKRYHHT